ncbi:MAG: hypothetical protein KGI73_04710 [Patescibacteria group bacterium]|nr:hypothetical protein [Patescibacteria group bacterium]
MPLGELKTAAGIAAAVLSFLSYVPYLTDMFRGRTKPHPYTWLVWGITTGTAAAGAWYGGGGFGAAPLFFWTALTFFVFFLSLRYGTKDITWMDAVFLVLALAAIVVWWQLKNPVLAVSMVTAVDALGYFPTFRKLIAEPWSESLISWTLFTATACAGLLALSAYNYLTVVYLAMSATANVLVITLSLFRRRAVPKPISARN